jgi:hypothetical protein
MLQLPAFSGLGSEERQALGQVAETSSPIFLKCAPRLRLTAGGGYCLPGCNADRRAASSTLDRDWSRQWKAGETLESSDKKDNP